MENVVDSSGQVNWKAAFYADPGATKCPECDTYYWREGKVLKCTECACVFDTERKSALAACGEVDDE